MAVVDDPVLAEQTEYYRARAGEYDDWWRRIGRYDRGTAATERWRIEVAEVEDALERAALTGDVLELACGTGWWTERLARTAGSLTCIDASPETIALNRARLRNTGLILPRYEIADLFAWTSTRTFDAVFFSFWLSHVPLARFQSFWTSVAAALKPGGRIFLVDSLPHETSTARDHMMPDPDGIQERRLNDGRTFRIVKLFHRPAELTQQLANLGWHTVIEATSSYFIYGQATREV